MKKQDNENNDKTVTGHSWDNISEYNIPAPRWWLIVWLITIIWSFGYWYFYPTWPTTDGNSKGKLEWTQINQLESSQAEIDSIRAKYFNLINEKSFDEILADKKLLEYALVGGESAFKDNCAGCHGVGAQGYKGYPNLNDDDWLWGGRVNDIYITLLYGIRSGHEKARFNQMPSFGKDKILSKAQINEIIDHVLSLSNKNLPNDNGAKLYAQNCASCHGVNGKGNQELGAPNLSDEIWLYGSSRQDLYHTIYYSRAGVMPYWSSRLENAVIKQLSLYVYLLGGGEGSNQ
ncbi:cytochrome-c oxidase, cbb3-type subunit III [Rickettsiales bacterium]|nr:cytochrome-c oxidase, cbb3-type subunit III [Rickettsiales bacterium]